MGCKKLTYYEKPATPLRVLPDNEEITVVVVYSIRYNNEKVVQGWLLPDPADQFSNPYLAMGRTKREELLQWSNLASGQTAGRRVMYVDPDGEWILIPMAIGAISGAIRAHQQGSDIIAGIARGLILGGMSAMLAPIGGAGISLSANIGIGAAQGAAIGGFDAYLWGNDIAKGIGIGAATGAAFAFATSEQLRNAIKGKGLITNQKVLNNFRNGSYQIPEGVSWQNAVLEHFNFRGEYNPGSLDLNSPGSAGAAVRNIEGYENILYGDKAFESFDNLRGVYTKENFHLKMPLDEYMKLSRDQIEYEGFVHVYENRALYRNFEIDKQKPGTFASLAGRKLGMAPNYQVYERQMSPWGWVNKPQAGGFVFRYEVIGRFKYDNWYYKLPRRW